MRRVRLQRIRAREHTDKKFREHPFTEVVQPRYGAETEADAHDEQARAGKIETEHVPLHVPWWRRWVARVAEVFK